MIAEDLELELLNWSLWLLAGGWGYTRNALTSSAGLVTRYSPIETRYREARVPVRAGAAADVDRLVCALPADLRVVIYAEYLHIDANGRQLPSYFKQEETAAALDTSLRTYERNLAKARGALSEAMTQFRTGEKSP